MDHWSQVVGRWGLLVALAFLAGGCWGDAEPPVVDEGQAHGSIDIAVGQDVRTLELGQAQCRQKGDVLHVTAPAAVTRMIDSRPTRPHLISARLPADLDSQEVSFGADDPTFGAVASVAPAEYAGEEYEMLQLLAQRARGASSDYLCRASRDAEKISIVCNDTHVFPWAAPGPVPSGSFRASLECQRP
jgi:hypothetical protein